MSKRTEIKPLALAVSAALAASFAGTTTASADESVFTLTSLSSGYMIADAVRKGDDEGSCGGDKDAEAEGSCGGDKADEAEGSCGGDTGEESAEHADDAAADDADKGEEGSCGGDTGEEDKGEEGSCGGDTGEEDKGEEGKCGEGKCGGAV